ATQFVVGVVSSTVAGTALAVTVQALDPFGNLATGYRGTVHASSSDGQAVLPLDYSFTTADNGQHVFSMAVATVGNQTLTVTDTMTSAITGSATITVTPAAPATLALSTPPRSTSGTEASFTVTAHDAFGNLTPSYRGTIHFTSSDSQAVLPVNFTF